MWKSHLDEAACLSTVNRVSSRDWCDEKEICVGEAKVSEAKPKLKSVEIIIVVTDKWDYHEKSMYFSMLKVHYDTRALE